ncbi:hypothetical protein [Paracoccus marinaquae]|uniref:Uncharacterized protein n=1 Tax=Paracoccus marinaquae TaxID=2841926 RepID=A0ABS6ANU3_9RHOB|nr:hypothetical protein [Paracoccus marinaquae]MBU3032265.1 hypothetical protein [Paracoccus marinaquae]
MALSHHDEIQGTARQPAIGAIYARWTLDCISESARAVALDFTRRPRQYKRVPEQTALAIEELWYAYGNAPGFPDRDQRSMICVPLVGPCATKEDDMDSQFRKSAASLRDRAWDFSNRQVTTGEDNLRRAFLDDLIPFRSYLESMQENAVVNNGARQLDKLFQTSVGILKDDMVASVFGRPAPTIADWPLGNSFDETGSRLMEEISLALDGDKPKMTQSRFLVLQRIAFHGAKTIANALTQDLEPGDPEKADPLIGTAYSWKTAIDALGSKPAEARKPR